MHDLTTALNEPGLGMPESVSAACHGAAFQKSSTTRSIESATPKGLPPGEMIGSAHTFGSQGSGICEWPAAESATSRTLPKMRSQICQQSNSSHVLAGSLPYFELHNSRLLSRKKGPLRDQSKYGVSRSPNSSSLFAYEFVQRGFPSR